MRALPIPAFSPPDLITAAAVREGDLVAVMGTIVPICIYVHPKFTNGYHLTLTLSPSGCVSLY